VAERDDNPLPPHFIRPEGGPTLMADA